MSGCDAVQDSFSLISQVLVGCPGFQEILVVHCQFFF